MYIISPTSLTVASLGLVSPAAVTDSVTLFFFVKKTDELFYFFFFSRHPQNVVTFLVIVNRHLVTPTLSAFQLVVSPVSFVRFSRKK